MYFLFFFSNCAVHGRFLSLLVSPMELFDTTFSTFQTEPTRLICNWTGLQFQPWLCAGTREQGRLAVLPGKGLSERDGTRNADISVTECMCLSWQEEALLIISGLLAALSPPLSLSHSPALSLSLHISLFLPLSHSVLVAHLAPVFTIRNRWDAARRTDRAAFSVNTC